MGPGTLLSVIRIAFHDVNPINFYPSVFFYRATHYNCHCICVFSLYGGLDYPVFCQKVFLKKIGPYLIIPMTNGKGCDSDYGEGLQENIKMLRRSLLKLIGLIVAEGRDENGSAKNQIILIK